MLCNFFNYTYRNLIQPPGGTKRNRKATRYVGEKAGEKIIMLLPGSTQQSHFFFTFKKITKANDGRKSV